MMETKYNQDWAFADQDKLKEEQLREIARLPLVKKLEWLEQMQEIIEYLKVGKEKNLDSPER